MKLEYITFIEGFLNYHTAQAINHLKDDLNGVPVKDGEPPHLTQASYGFSTLALKCKELERHARYLSPDESDQAL